ncbi:cell division protein FtsW [Bryobacterales bacterium F-183]|nr:cell division protein FtsW [Bryobacterales bacterium F-183]
MRTKTDWTLFFTTVAMVCFGLVMVYSASAVVVSVNRNTLELEPHLSYSGIVRQGLFAIVSFILMMLIKRYDYQKMDKPVWAFGITGVVILALLAVVFVDSEHHRWFRLFMGAKLQPSEFAKPALVLFLAFFLTHRRQDVNSWYTLAPACLVVGLVAFMVVVGDYGTALVLVAPAVVMFVVAGLNMRYLAVTIMAVFLCSLLAVLAIPYRRARVVAFVDPKHETVRKLPEPIKSFLDVQVASSKTNYQANQAKLALGSGGLFGAGLMQSRQKHRYLPESESDYIFALVGEELGFWGCFAVLLGFGIILWRGLRLFFIAPDDFGKYLALGITASIVVQALFNMTVALDLVPSKGIPLPMISAGGSSMMATLISLGLVLSVSERAG